MQEQISFGDFPALDEATCLVGAVRRPSWPKILLDEQAAKRVPHSAGQSARSCDPLCKVASCTPVAAAAH